MPTGYTANIGKGITFEEFALGCAKGFGACISMRDEPGDKKIPEEFEPSTYHIERLEEATIKLAEIEKLSLIEAGERARAEYKEELKSLANTIKEKAELRGKYANILTQAHKWHPPTSEHSGLKKFMIEQVSSSIDFDCDTAYYQKELDNLEVLHGEQWKKREIQKCLKDIEYHTKGNAEELDLVGTRNKWVKELRASLVED